MKKGWEIKKLGEVCRFINGKAYSKNELLAEGKYPVLRVGNFFTNNHWYYSDLELEEDKYCDNGDLLYAWSASFGPRIWEGEKVIYHYHIWKVIPNTDLISKEFLFQLLQWDMEAIKTAHGTGTTMMHVGKGSMENRLAPIPSLSEQQHIVSILDETFASLEQAKENVQRNLQNAKELFQSELNSIFENKGVNWLEKSLKEIGETQTGNTPPTKEPDNYGDFIPFVKPPHFKVDGTIDSEESGLSEKGLKSARLFKANSILMVCIGATIGKTGFSEIPLTSNQQINALTPKEEFEPRFFYYALITDNFFKKIIHGSSQATLPIINKGKWESLTVAFPKDKKEQKKIVNQLDTLSTETKNLENIYQQKLNALAELKKSILQKAFNGELAEPSGELTTKIKEVSA